MTRGLFDDDPPEVLTDPDAVTMLNRLAERLADGRVSPTEPLRRFALTYANLGLEVFPVNPATKTPLNSQYKATTQRDVIAGWWEQWPDALIGHRVAVDQVILDIDPRHGGLDTWDLLDDTIGGIQLGRAHFSGRGDDGFHAWFPRPEGGRISAKRLHEWAREHEVGKPIINKKTGEITSRWTSGIDLLHHTWRYTILPPSPHPTSGQPYRWRDVNGMLVAMPEALAALLVPLTGHGTEDEDGDTDDEPNDNNFRSVREPSFAHSDSIADWFTASHTWRSILERHGWSLAEGDGDTDGSLWRHPDADPKHSHSASIRHSCLFVYSDNTIFEPTEDSDPTGYTKFRAWALLEHGGDLAAAARQARTLKNAESSSAGRDSAQPEGDADPVPAFASFNLTKLSTVEPEAVSWLWDGYVALSKIGVLDGLPDLGKSTITIDIASRITQGAAMPDGSRGALYGIPADVIMFTAEDGLADTVRPRVDAAGGDATRIHIVNSTRIRTGNQIEDRWPDLAHDLDALTGAIEHTGARLVVVDVLMAYLGPDVNSYRDQDVRRVMGPLASLAEETGCSVLCLRHPTKTANPTAILSGGASIAIIGSVRVGLLSAWDPDDKTEDQNLRRRLLAVSKCNIAPKAPTLAYRTVKNPSDLMAHIRWEGPTSHRADDLTAPAVRDDDHAVIDELVAQLTEGALTVGSKDVEKTARANGVATRVLTAKLRKAGWRSKPDGFSGPIIWVPSSSDASSDVSDAHVQKRDITDITDDITGEAVTPDEPLWEEF